MSKRLKNVKLLVFGHAYMGWVKEIVEIESKFVYEINVILHHNFLVEISNYLPFGGYFDHLRWYTKQRMIDLLGKPDNVNVYLISMFYFVPDGWNKRLGDKLTKKFESFIKRKQIKFDLIHAHFAYPQGYVAAKLGQKFNVPVVITTHGHDIYEMPFRDNGWEKMIKWTLEQATHIITVSQRNKYIMTQKLRINDGKISVIPNGYNSNKFRPMPKEIARNILGLPQNRKIILNVGNLYPAKGHKYLIEAIKVVIEKRKDILCIIVGDGPLKKTWKNNLKSWD